MLGLPLALILSLLLGSNVIVAQAQYWGPSLWRGGNWGWGMPWHGGGTSIYYMPGYNPYFRSPYIYPYYPPVMMPPMMPPMMPYYYPTNQDLNTCPLTPSYYDANGNWIAATRVCPPMPSPSMPYMVYP